MTSERRPPGKARDRFEAIYPLTPAQEGMLYHTVAAPGSGVYVEQLAFRSAPGFRPNAFRQAVEAAVERSPILRTGFSWEQREKPLQVVLRKVRLPVSDDDWSGLEDAAVESCFEELMAADRRRGFDLRKPPALRLRLMDLGKGGHLCLLSYHHILLDAWSLAQLFGEILADYRARLRGAAISFDPVPPFGDFVRWLESRDPAAGEGFWRRHLDGIDGPTRLFLKPPSEEEDGPPAQGDLEHSLDSETSAAVSDLAIRCGLTPAVIAQAAWAIVLGAFTGRDDVVFGAAVAGRPPELIGSEAMVGLFINTVATRLRLPPDASLLPWLEACQLGQAERADHEHVPLAQVQHWAGMPPDQPLFESLVVFENVPVDRLAAVASRSDDAAGGQGELIFHAIDYRPQTHYSLTLLVVPQQPLSVRMLYRRSACDDELASRLLAAFEEVLRRMATQTDVLLGDLGHGLGIDRPAVEEKLACHPAVLRADLLPPSWDRRRFSLQLELPPEASAELTAEVEAWVTDRIPASLAGVVDRLWLPAAGGAPPPGDDPTAGPWYALPPAPGIDMARLETFAADHRVSPETVQVAAFALLLARLTGVESPVFPVEQHFMASPRGSVDRRWLKLAPRVEASAPAAVLLATVRWELLTARAGLLAGPASAADGCSASTPRLRWTGDGVEGAFGASLREAIVVEPTAPVRWRAAFGRLLAQLMERPMVAVADLPWLAGVERQQLLVEWNDTVRRDSAAQLPHRPFEEQAHRAPDSLAVVVGDASLSYGELERRANQVAHRLVELGVGPEVAVGLCLERSFEMVVGFLAVLKAGGVHVPLDPAYPAGRLALMVDDASIGVLLGVAATRDRLPEVGTVPVLALDDPAEFLGRPEVAPAARAAPENLGYVIYTSGSTGRPKGVGLSLAVMSNLVRWQLGLTPLPTAGRTLQFTSFSFDVSVLEILAPLSSAGVLILLREEDRRDFGAIVRQLVKQRVERLILPFTALEHLAEHLEDSPVDVLSLRYVVSTGEALQITPPVAKLFGRLPDTVLINGYGPSETHFISDHRLPSGSPATWPKLPPIGRAILNSSIHVADRWLHAVPVGVPGELVLGGLQLARGYLGRPAATAERFVPDPWGGSGGRLYRSGDLARRRSDGALDYLGRIDHQVKVRGFRVELGEIEVALRRHPTVQEAAIVARPGALPGDQRLEAFVVPRPGAGIDAGELAATLGATLPEYMVPSLFHGIDALPQTPTGKLDRRRLMEIERVGTEAIADSGDVTRDLLASLWCNLLAVATVTAEDDFFALGGHSLLATRLASRIRRVFGVELPIATVFETSRLGRQAMEIDRLQRAGAKATPPIRRAPRDRPLPLSFAQQRLWLHERLEDVGWAYNIPSALALEGPLQVAALAASLAALEERHEVLRTCFEKRDGSPVQVIGSPRRRPLPRVDLEALGAKRAQRELERLLAESSRRIFDLTRGPLWRALLVRLAASRHVLFLNFHHIIIDLWSVGVLVREVSELYRAALAARPPQLAPPALQYADFAAWQRRWLEGPLLEAQLDAWRDRLRGAPDEIALPLARGAVSSEGDSRGGDHTVFLSGDLRRRLEAFGRDSGATPFMVLLAAFEVMVHRHTDETDLVVGTDFANRVREETESMVGFFINVLPLRTDLSGRPTFKRLVQRVRQTALAAHANQDVPFDFLVKELGAARKSRSPLVRVLFVYQNTPRETLDLGELGARDLAVGTGTSKFDLAVFLDRDGDGLSCWFSYRRAVYEPAAIERLAARYRELLGRLLDQPERRIDEFQILTDRELKEKTMEIQRKASESKRRFAKFQRRRPQAVSLETESLVDSSYLTPDSTLPRVLTPRVPDVDLAEWAAANRELIEKELNQHGAILLRGFGIDSVPAFEHFAARACDQLFGEYGDLPKEAAGKKVYKSTPYPADKMILFHNESAHMDRWPLRQFFLCVQPAEEGGETPILDCRRIYESLDPEIRRAFEDKGLLYVRNFIEGIDVSWRDFFRTEDRTVAEAKCREAGMAWEWLDNGLRTEQRCPAVATHPKTGERVFFNQIQLHHIACLDSEVRDSMRQLYSERELPRNVYFGDGSPIPDEVMATIGDLYDRMSVAFPWQKGDILMVDNMLIAHARNPFKGAGRRIAVVMGDMFEQSALATVN